MKTSSYSSLISPETYNALINVHRYIPESDAAIARILREASYAKSLRVLEVGCGPGRILPLLARTPNTTLFALDSDAAFLAHAASLLHQENLSHVSLIEREIFHYQTDSPFDVVISQGFHHHLPQKQRIATLRHIASLLKPHGLYILSDEFLPPYTTPEERNVRVVLWYAHIIASALADAQPALAYEEAKTLLDDLSLGIKTPEQIAYTLEYAPLLDASLRAGDHSATLALVNTLLTKCLHSLGKHTLHDPLMELSRGDYKIDHGHFFAEITAAGFEIVTQETYGPAATVGGMTVYLLRKTGRD